MISLQSLRTHLGLLLVLAFGPIFGLTVYWSYLAQKNRLAETEASELRLVRQVATTYGQVIQRSREVLLTLSRLPEVQRLDEPRCGALLAGLLPSYQPQYSNLEIARANGDLFCSAHPVAQPFNVAQMHAFVRAVETRSFAIGDFTVNRVTGRPMLTMASPVLDEHGAIVGVAGALLSVDWLNELASEFSLPEGASLTIVDGSGRVVVRQPDSARWVGQDVRGTPLFDARLRGETTFDQAGLDGVRRRFLLASVESVPAPAFLSVSLGVDSERTLAPIRAALYRDLAVLFGVALAAFAAAWFGTERSVIRRVDALLAATRRVAAGDLGARAGAAHGGPSELRQLGQAFDDMAAGLQQREREKAQELSERKRAEEAAREWRDRYEAVILASGQVLYDWDARTNKSTYGGNFEQTLGYSATEMAGGFVHWLEIIHPDDLPRFNAELERTVASKTPFHLEYRVRHREGRFVIVQDDGYPILDGAGGLTRVCGVVTDVTERKRAEEQRLRLEAQLRQAQKMEALGTLAGGIAHDFNNILGAIIGNVALATQDVGANHPAQESLAEISKAGARARDLVQQILTFSRQQPLTRRVVDLREVVKESVKLLRATLPAGIELVTAIAPDAPNVLADRSQMHQVLMNLCTNAWQAIESSIGRIEISLVGVVVADEAIYPALRPGRHARLTVTDTGKGMDEATVQRIFDPFFTTKALGEGTGLGLSVVDGIVKSHDGAITVYSAPGQGTVFHLYFPAVEADADALRAAPVALPRGHGQRILYLDDEEALVLLATRLLGRLGYAVKGFTRAAEALAAFHADPAGFDLCVTDLNMPAASGLEVATEILRQRPDLPVALASGYVTEALRAQAFALGIREVIYKPNTVEELAAAIGRLLADLKRPAPQAG